MSIYDIIPVLRDRKQPKIFFQKNRKVAFSTRYQPSREKNSGSFFSKYRQLFRIFLGKFLDISRNFRDFSGNFLEKFQPILDRFYRYFSRRKKPEMSKVLPAINPSFVHSYPIFLKFCEYM